MMRACRGLVLGSLVLLGGCGAAGGGNGLAAAAAASLGLGGGDKKAAVIELSSTSISFGQQLIGTPSSSRTLSIRNTGTADLSVSGLSFSGANVDEFTQTHDCATVSVGKACSIILVFTPKATGERSASLVLQHNASGSTTSVPITGTGVAPKLSVSPSSINFGDRATGSISQTEVITLKSSGTAALSVRGISIVGSDAGDFSQSGNCSTIAAGQSCLIEVRFAPRAAGEKRADISISHDASSGPEVIPLSGVGITPQITVSPTAVNFQSQVINTRGQFFPIVVRNSGAQAATITSARWNGAGADQFVIVNECSSLAPRQECLITVSFAPTSPGQKTASVALVHSAASSPQTVGLFGTGVLPNSPQLVIDPTVIEFADREIGTTSAPRTITLTNEGAVSLTVRAVNLVGVGSGQFLQTNNCGDLLPGRKCQVDIRFSPSSTGEKRASVSVDHSAPGSPSTVGLVGLGVVTSVSVNPTSIDFGDLDVGKRSTIREIVFKNTGTTKVTVESVTVDGPDATNFSQENDCGSLSPAQSCIIKAVFNPKSVDSKTSTIKIKSNFGSSPISVSLAGAGKAVLTAIDVIASASNPALASFGNGKTLVAYRRGIDTCGFGGCHERSQSWHQIVDANGVFAPPRRTNAALDANGTVNVSSRAPTSAVALPDLLSAVLSLGHSAHNSSGGNAAVIGSDGEVKRLIGGSGAYQSEVCAVGPDVVLSSLYVDPVTHRANYFANAAEDKGQINFGGYGSNYAARQDIACGVDAELGKFAIVGYGGPTRDWRLRYYKINTDINWEQIGSDAVVSTSASGGARSTWPMNIAFSGRKGISVYRDRDSDGRAQIYFVRFSLSPTSGLQLADSGRRIALDVGKYEGLYASIVHSGFGEDFYIALYSAGSSAAGEAANTNQALSLHKINHSTGVVSALGVPYESSGWIATNDLGDQLVSDNYFYSLSGGLSLALSCDGNLYVGAAFREGSERSTLRVFRYPVSSASACGGQASAKSYGGLVVGFIHSVLEEAVALIDTIVSTSKSFFGLVEGVDAPTRERSPSTRFTWNFSEGLSGRDTSRPSVRAERSPQGRGDSPVEATVASVVEDRLTGSSYRVWRKDLDGVEGHHAWALEYVGRNGAVLGKRALFETANVAWRSESRVKLVPTSAWAEFCSGSVWVIQDGYRNFLHISDASLGSISSTELRVGMDEEMTIVSNAACNENGGLRVESYLLRIDGFSPQLGRQKVPAKFVTLQISKSGEVIRRSVTQRSLDLGELCGDAKMETRLLCSELRRADGL